MSYSYTAGDWNAGAFPGGTTEVDSNTPGAAGTSGTALGTATGRMGFSLVDTSDDDTGNPFIDVWRWVNTPLTTPLDPFGLALATFIVLFAIFMWGFIVYHIRIAAEAI